jgi:hypothetical protein
VSVSVTGCVGPMVPVPAPPAASGHKIDERCRVNKSLARRRFWQRHPFLVRQVGHEVQRLGRERGRLCRTRLKSCETWQLKCILAAHATNSSTLPIISID